jgi:beta-glucosidase
MKAEVSRMNLTKADFPDGFRFGAATAAYQIEGTNFGTCGSSHWDKFARDGGTRNKENGDIACAHYELWQQDLDLMKQAGFDAYRFSIAWPRIQPEGRGRPLAEGLDFYDRLVDGVLERGLEPYATLYHWDLPLALSEKGGWRNRDTALRFADYTAHVCERLDGRLASVATINEPWCVAWLSHFIGAHAPGLTDISAAGKAMHNILLAHGESVAVMRELAQANLGIVLNMEYSNPATDSEADRHAAQIHDGIYNRWFVEALTKGRYPPDILEHLEVHLPEGWQADMDRISAPLDWLGINYYTRTNHADDGTGVFPFSRTVAGDLPKSSMGWEVNPEGLEYFLRRTHTDYTRGIPLYVTENGTARRDVLTGDGVDDPERCDYFARHLEGCLRAIENGVPVKGYFAWSLLDNFEWAFGYSERFGIVHVDYDTQKRTPKSSYHMFRKFLQR